MPHRWEASPRDPPLLGPLEKRERIDNTFGLAQRRRLPQSHAQEDGVVLSLQLLEGDVSSQGVARLDLDTCGVLGGREDRVDFLPRVFVAVAGDDAIGRTAEPVALFEQGDRVPVLQQSDRTGQPRRPAAHHGHSPSRRGFRQPHAHEPFVPGDPAYDELDVADGNRVLREDPLQAAALALHFGRAHVRAHLRKHVRAAENVVGLGDIVVGKRPDEPRHVDVRRAIGRAGGKLAVLTPPCLLAEAVQRQTAAQLVLKAVDLAVADHAAGHGAVAHDLGAARAGDARLRRVHAAFGEDVPGRVGISERTATLANKRGPLRPDHARRNVRHQVPEPTIPGGDHGQLGERLLDAAGDIHEPHHA